MECVERTQAVAKAMAEKNWDLAVQLRGRSFARNLETYKMLTRLKPPKESFDAEGKPVVSVCCAICIKITVWVSSMTLNSFFTNYRKDLHWLLCTSEHQLAVCNKFVAHLIDFVL